MRMCSEGFVLVLCGVVWCEGFPRKMMLTGIGFFAFDWNTQCLCVKPSRETMRLRYGKCKMIRLILSRNATCQQNAFLTKKKTKQANNNQIRTMLKNRLIKTKRAFVMCISYPPQLSNDSVL